MILVTRRYNWSWSSLEVAIRLLNTLVVDRLTMVICVIYNHFFLFGLGMITADYNFAVDNPLVVV